MAAATRSDSWRRPPGRSSAATSYVSTYSSHQRVDLRGRRPASTASTRSLTPQVLTDTPKRISAATLSPSVTATSRMLSPKRASARCWSVWCPAAARAHRPTDAWTLGIGDVAEHRLALDAHAGLDERELAVAVGGLVQVHEVHVDGRPRQRLVGLGVQVQQRLAERLEPADPHLRRREGVHPRDHADAAVVVAGVEAGPADGVGGGQDRLEDDADRQRRRRRRAGRTTSPACAATCARVSSP